MSSHPANNSTILTRTFGSPVGPLIGGATPGGVCLCEFSDRDGEDRVIARLAKRHRAPVEAPAIWDPDLHGDSPQAAHLDNLERQLAEYFANTRRDFDLALDLGGTPWQQRVWEALLKVPYGSNKSYGEIAKALGNPGGSRAVGKANGDNPVVIVVPCHRIVQADGGLRGYGGGLHRKRWLLDFEAGTLQLPL